MLIRVIQSAHLFLVICIAISVIVPLVEYKKRILGILLCLLFRYLSGYTKCGLTELEYNVKGEKYKEGFIYRLINPILTIPEKYFDEYLFNIHVMWIIILVRQIYY